jgi:Uma2 family endonuclease
MITSIDQLDLTKTYSYADYLKWRFEESVELIKGKVIRMSPAPTTSHQRVSLNLTLEFGNYLKGSSCSVFASPFDVRLIRKEDDTQIKTVVQPDLCIICDAQKIDEKGCYGAPDLIVEILSPATSKKDVKDKYELYQEAGVLEYWVIDPIAKLVDVFFLKEEKYTLVKKYVSDEMVPVHILPGFSVDLKEVFE